MSFSTYRSTPKNEPFKPGDTVQFKVTTLAGVTHFMGQVWCNAPAATTYWVATDAGRYHQVWRGDMRLVYSRDMLNLERPVERRAA
jgi:hypothetical protein